MQQGVHIQRTNAEALAAAEAALAAALNRQQANHSDDEDSGSSMDEGAGGLRRRGTRVTATITPDMDWSGLPTLNLDDIESIYPWVRSFEEITAAQGCTSTQRLHFFRRLPHAVTGCKVALRPFIEPIQQKSYKKLRNAMLVHFGHIEPVTGLLLTFMGKKSAMKSSAEWVLQAKITHEELRIAAEAHALPSQANIEVHLLQAVIEAYSGVARHRLTQRLWARKDSPTLMQQMLTALPAWEHDALAVCAAAAPYKPPQRPRPPRQRPQFGGRTPQQHGPWKQQQHNSGQHQQHQQMAQQQQQMVQQTKRVDRGQRTQPCNYCGANPACQKGTCPAASTTCTRCLKKGHFSRVCRSPDAVVVKT